MNGDTQKIPIFLLISNEKLKTYIIDLCKRNNFRPFTGADLEGLVEKIRKRSGAVIVMDYEVVTAYGARIYSRINVACPGCNLLLLCDQDQRDLIKEAVEHDVYACILPPYEEWEVLTMIRNIVAKEKLQDQKKVYKKTEYR